VAIGSNLTLSVTAGGSALKYQWQLNGKNIAGATHATYTLVDTSSRNSGTYRVVVTSGTFSTTSSGFLLTVLYPPTITTQPRPLTVKSGSSATFTVKVSSTSTTPLGYQWTFNGAPLSDGPNLTGSLTPSLTITDVTSANAGPYQVVITNAAGTLTSASVKLTVK
ncbi:MAG: immunoglobulin domain-containing protein, partial [Opitutales bacterium]